MKYVLCIWVILLIIISITWLPKYTEQRSARSMLNIAKSQMPAIPVYIFGHQEFSASYYSNGNNNLIESPAELENLINNNKNKVKQSILIILNKDYANELQQKKYGRIIYMYNNLALFLTKI
jgi:hypothetical protein